MARQVQVEEKLGDPWLRQHHTSPAVDNVDKLSMLRPQDFCSVPRLAEIGLRHRLDEVIRWKPRNVSRLMRRDHVTELEMLTTSSSPKT